jgi:hypothetical protein
MRCSHCDARLDPSHVFIWVIFSPAQYVANLHPHCAKEIIGKAAFNALTREVYTSGWSQMQLPVDYSTR